MAQISTATMDNKMTQPTQPDTRTGVILRPSLRARCWILTVNNWNQEDLKTMTLLTQKSTHWVIGKEGEGEGKTPHLQCYLKFKHARSFDALKKKIPKAHLEKARGNEQDNLAYCSKEGNFTTNIRKKLSIQEIADLVRAEYNDVKWREWQSDVLKIVDEDGRDTRKIHWIYEKTGNVGKSFLAKFLCLRPDTVISSGKMNDIFNQVNILMREEGYEPKLILCDIPRTCLQYLSYTAIECLKNGVIYSGKYEGGKCVFRSPKVICFANEPPQMEKLSKDRWCIYKILEGKLFKKVF